MPLPPLAVVPHRVCRFPWPARWLAATLLGLVSLGAAVGLRPQGTRTNRAIAPSMGALGPSDVAVVVNQADPLSEAIGRHYQRRRGIPAAQIIRIRFEPGVDHLDPLRFQELRRQIFRQTPAHVQIYAVAWASPWRVGCQSITSALSLGLDPAWCAKGCRLTRLSPYYARGDVLRPWDSLRIRPSMLLAARSEDQARRLIGRGLAADGTAPPGTVYLLSTTDRARNTRAAGFGDVQRLIGPSLAVRLLQADRLRGANDVIALLTGSVRVEGIDSNRYRPGAVADHLTSFGGQLVAGAAQGGQMSALRWLEAGATGSYGTVVEPCNFPAKFPNPLVLLAHYRGGSTLIEAYWRSVAMPGQGVFIGEPLARPWPGGGSDANARRDR
ncbi:MAG: TIGR03790 family protein [Cyanobacteriota bacterium]|nr:TIGR03790 family protein [Cyanobacteriota bacterium]